MEYYPTSQPLVACRECHAHIALQDELVSKAFHGQHGEAYLYRSVDNKAERRCWREAGQGTRYGAPYDRRCIVSGMWDRSWMDICKSANKFKAYVESQAYKEGKYILEKELIVQENNWSPF